MPGAGAGRPRKSCDVGLWPPEDEVAMSPSVNGVLPAGLACSLRSGDGGCCAMGVRQRGAWAVQASPRSGSRLGLHLHKTVTEIGTFVCHRCGARCRLLISIRPGDSPRYCSAVHSLWYSEGPWSSRTAQPTFTNMSGPLCTIPDQWLRRISRSLPGLKCAAVRTAAGSMLALMVESWWTGNALLLGFTLS